MHYINGLLIPESCLGRGECECESETEAEAEGKGPKRFIYMQYGPLVKQTAC